MAYNLPATTFSKSDRDQIASALYISSLPNLGTNRNFAKELRYTPGKFLGLGLNHPHQEQGIEHLKHDFVTYMQTLSQVTLSDAP